MTSPFSEHLRNSIPDTYPDMVVLEAVRRILRCNMRRRGLLGLPPRYLGYSQYQTWEEEGAEGDLAFDCYKFAFGASKWDSLCRKLNEYGNVDGVVRLNVGNFLTELQKKHDSVGYAVFKNLEGAVRLAIEAGIVSATNLRGHKVHNGTVLRFARNRDAVPAAPEGLRELLQAMDVWPQVERQLARISPETQAFLVHCLAQLGAAGVSGVTFQDLVDVLKKEARSCMKLLYGPECGEPILQDGGATDSVSAVSAGISAEDHDGFAALRRCIADHIRLIKQKRVRDRVQAIFREITDALDRDDDPPKQAELVRLLGFPRSTVSDGFAHLKEFAADCRAKLG